MSSKLYKKYISLKIEDNNCFLVVLNRDYVASSIDPSSTLKTNSTVVGTKVGGVAGGLVGGASLKPDEFAKIVNYDL